ncbi:MAG: hypothetical protein HY648_00615, partial [Acidobacteria bacterium]|nr:hypothetical protein [Acidobacteriota bacterium]
MLDKFMSTVAKIAPPVEGESRRVYCQNREIAALLEQNASWETLSYSGRLPRAADASIVLGDTPAVFTPELRRAIEESRARLIYVLPQGTAPLPAEATGTPIFSFLAPPVQATVLHSLVNAAFESLAMARRQVNLEQ